MEKKHSPLRLPLRAVLGVLFCALLAFNLLSGCSAFFTVVPLEGTREASQGSASNKGFDKVGFVDSIWESKVLPTVQEKPVDFQILYPELKANQQEASQKYGNKVGGPYNFLTRFEGKVTAVETSSRNGLITIETSTPGGTVPVQVQVGPVIRGTALRDSLGFLTFDQFVNQLQFADVADELNNRVLNSTLKGLDPNTLKDRTVSITGAFTLDNIDKIVVTPVFMEVK